MDRATIIALVSQYGACSVAKSLANATWDSWEVTFSQGNLIDYPVRITDNHYDVLAKGIEKAIADYVNAGGQ
jgi:hypothetical protein